MKKLFLGGVLGFGLAVVLLIAATSFPATAPRPRLVTDYSRLVGDVDEGKVEHVTFRGSHIFGKFKDGRVFESYTPHAQVVPALTERLLAKGVNVGASPPPDEDPAVPSLLSALINWAPLLVSYALFFAGVWFVMARPVLTLSRQLESYIRATQQRSAEPPQSPP